eukprot:857313-Amorphochlora_amoeboformis.AAC.1
MGSGGRKEVSDYRKKLSIIICHNPNGQQSTGGPHDAASESQNGCVTLDQVTRDIRSGHA